MMGLFQLEKIMAVVRKRMKVTQIRSIKAAARVKVGEKETVLKEINWANNQYREEVCADESRQLGFSIISRRYDEVEVRKFIESLSCKVHCLLCRLLCLGRQWQSGQWKA